MKKFGVFVTLIILLIGCSSNQDTQANNEKSEGKITIYSTLYPLAYFAEEIGGELVEVETVLPPGADPHNYEPTSKTMIDIAESDMFLFNGANLEAYASKMEEALAEEDVLMVEASEGVSLVEHVHHHEEQHEQEDTHEGEKEHGHDHEDGEDHGHEHEAHDQEDEEDHEHTDNQQVAEESNDGHDHDHGDADPHLWLDPIRAIELARNVKDSLIELHPDQEETFDSNFHSLEERLIELDESYHQQLENATNNEILVTHAAYGYWEQSYGIEQIALAGLSPSEEPSQKQLENIIDHVQERNIQYLLFEQNVEPKVAEVIQAETNVESLQLHNLSILTEEDVENQETYFTLMERNLEVLNTALEY
ncbi:metal ABC transporter solute-binding protein, Zn/Mn family [Gracilibacillus kekensis]|uniref:Zinc transport system substrate-binding protein n=1 Tax=Gracilibacillus kekensis TaxID=1027249 RepID=A0A1M7IDX4_9BACI|nr:zinc ABC transporter substrate-binding protein [Gracilibacillus kekensis]SHM39026.1 zinc transport system substrate-binding protein [Gracilibacillus kekensis]